MEQRTDQITVDEQTASLLRDAGYEFDICGPDGEILGRYRSNKLIKLYATAQAPEGWDEMRRRVREEDGITTDELLARLEAEPCRTK